jgi:hypothetical protein
MGADSAERMDGVITPSVHEPPRRRATLPPLPARMRELPVDPRGYPVPWFVHGGRGAAPDFRVMDRDRWLHAIRFGACWICGETVGRKRTYVIGPMCGITRTTSEPGCHHECATFAALACPFMILPAAQRRRAKLPEDIVAAPGHHIERNPGVTCLWTTAQFSVFAVDPEIPGAVSGQLLRLGEPAAVSWYAEGRPATREEVLASIEDGMPALNDSARAQGDYALAALQSMICTFTKHLP